jgi:hypothetical protein
MADLQRKTANLFDGTKIEAGRINNETGIVDYVSDTSALSFVDETVTISTSVDEKNVCTKDQVKMANMKGWKVMGYDVAYEDVGGWFFDYEGSDPAGIQTITLDNDSNVLIYDLNGRKLVKSNKGVNIIDGKKVIIK